MKTKFITVAILLVTIFNIYAQDENFDRFEIDVSVNFWTPTSQHLKATNRIIQTYNGANYASSGTLNGYGTSIAPILNFSYYFNNNLGITLGFHPLIMNNKIKIQETDTSYSKYENSSFIPNFTLGIAGNIAETSLLKIYYGFGINFIPAYEFTIYAHSNGTETANYKSSDIALGFYLRNGMKIKLTKFMAFRMGLEYNFISTELLYSSSNGNNIYEKTNIGGMGLQAGLSFNF